MRSLPAGPTMLDEMANAAFILKLMTALPEEYGDIVTLMLFDQVQENSHVAARQGLRSQFTCLHGQSLPAADLVLDQLLPLARGGLRQANIFGDDIDRYLGVIEKRVKGGQTGALWILNSLAAMEEDTPAERMQALASAMLDQQKANNRFMSRRWLSAKPGATGVTISKWSGNSCQQICLLCGLTIWSISRPA